MIQMRCTDFLLKSVINAVVWNAVSERGYLYILMDLIMLKSYEV